MAEIVTGAAAPPVVEAAAVSPAKIFWATWFGWMLDGFNSSMYGYILVGALTELLPASGIEASRANIGLYGGLLFSIFMLGWACSMVWGWAADRYGRVRIMCWTVLVYSVFTALCGLSTGVVMFALFRFIAGFGIGGEWAAGTPLLHESVPEQDRVRLAGWLHTATPTGLFMAALVTLIGGESARLARHVLPRHPAGAADRISAQQHSGAEARHARARRGSPRCFPAGRRAPPGRRR